MNNQKPLLDGIFEIRLFFPDLTSKLTMSAKQNHWQQCATPYGIYWGLKFIILQIAPGQIFLLLVHKP